MTRNDFLELWRGTWDGDAWFAQWKNGLEKVNAAQAAWKPAPDRHSVWQNVNHVIFWRNYTVASVKGTPKPTEEEMKRLNFAEPTDKSDSAWKKTVTDLEKSHRDIEKLIADPNQSLDRIKHHLAHDAYHMGQIQQLLAMQGMAPVM